MRCAMIAAALLILAGSAFATDRIDIESFDYRSVAAARSAWRPVAPSPPITLMRRSAGGGTVAVIRADLGKLEDRACYDRKIKLDLSAAGRITLSVHTDRPEAIRSGTIYFQSGGGWYGGWFAVDGDQWQPITLDRHDFAPEDDPAGWSNITGVRLSFWKQPGTTGRVTVAVDDIAARTAPVRVVFGDRSSADPAEARSVKQYCRRVTDLLTQAGVRFVVINDTDVEAGGLSGASVAIFPHNPHMSPEEVERTIRFIDTGGKVMAFYSIPARLAEAMGMKLVGWRKAKHDGELSYVRFADHDRQFRQDSWNMQQAAPLEEGTAVIARWVNAAGRGGDPAVLRSGRGQWMTHVLTAGDDDAKRRFLVTSIAALAPALGPALAEAAVERAAEPITGGAAAAHLDRARASVPAGRLAEAEAKLDEAGQSIALARAHLAAGGPLDLQRVLTWTDRARDEAQRAMMLAFATWDTDVRGVWCHDAAGVKGWSWNRAAEHLADCGINVLFVNMLWGGRAYYPSDHLPAAPDLPERADYLRDCLAACRAHGIEVHVWKVNYNLSGAPADFVARMRREGRLQADRQGNELPWLSPSHPDNFALERNSMLEIVRKYDVAGIHFDYIRYPGARADYSSGARHRFERDAGMTVRRWPGDVIDGPLADRFAQWRQDQISRLVEAVSTEAHRIRPDVKVSAAVFAEYPRCRWNVGQDWVRWVRRGWLDFICPMNYTPSVDQQAHWTKQQRTQIGRRIRLYPGVGVTASHSQLDPVETAEQIMAIREAGGDGFVLFEYRPATATDHLPALGVGLTKR